MSEDGVDSVRESEFDEDASVDSAGFRPKFFRYHYYDTGWRSAYLFLVGSPLLGLLAIWLGSLLTSASKAKAFLLGVALWGLGGLILLIGPLIGLGLAWTARSWARQFRTNPLIPAVVVAIDPPSLVGLADLGKRPADKGREFGLARTDLWSLPGHAREVGTRVPCVVDYTIEGPERNYYFSPYPVWFATGDPFDLERCIQKIGESRFRRLESLIARDLAPEHWNRMVIVDANDEVIETRGQMDASDLRRAARDAAEAASNSAED